MIGQRASEDIKAQISLKEKYKFGGYRCISLKIVDTKGGDFVENPDLSLIIVESQRKSIVAEISKDLPLLQGPDGLYKKIEIGVNNYDPSIFMNQEFSVYFLKDSKDYSQYQPYESLVGKFEPINEIAHDMDIGERIEKDLVAFGEFSSSDLIYHSVNKDDFTNIETEDTDTNQTV